MLSRRLAVLALVLIAPIVTACSTLPTGNDDDTPPPPAPTDTTKRGDNWPWT